MAGRNQHYIPRSLLRGFLSLSTGDTEKTWLYRRDKVINPALGGAAAQSFFYSRYAVDGTKTLDDIITDYEGRLGELITKLRSMPIGQAPDPLEVAEIITHLSVRSAHSRHALSHALKHFSVNAASVFLDEENLRNALGFSNTTPNENFADLLAAELAKRPGISQLPIPADLVTRIAFAFGRERFPKVMGEVGPQLKEMFERLNLSADDTARVSHIKALSASIVPEPRRQKLKNLSWRLAKMDAPIILPDCVAFCSTNGKEVRALMFAAEEEIRCAYLPLSSDRMLIGSSGDLREIEAAELNKMAAAISETFFVASQNDPVLLELRDLIGSASYAPIEESIDQAISLYQLTSKSDATDPQITHSHLALEDAPESPLTFDFHFHGNGSEDEVRAIAESIKVVVSAMRATIPLQRLDGITLADDYERAIQTIHGEAVSVEIQGPAYIEFGASVAQSIVVLRNGMHKVHIVMRSGLGSFLIGENEENRTQAIYVLATQLAEAGCLELVKQSFPDNTSLAHLSTYESWRYSCIAPAWTKYLCARTTAALAPDFVTHHIELTVNMLLKIGQTLPAARLQYRHNGDLDGLSAVVTEYLSTTLTFLANLAGHCDGVDASAFEFDEEEKLNAALASLNLREWFEVFVNDLRGFWRRRGLWSDPSELLVLNNHVDRLLWQFGIFAWAETNDTIHFEIPLATDLATLLNPRVD